MPNSKSPLQGVAVQRRIRVVVVAGGTDVVVTVGVTGNQMVIRVVVAVSVSGRELPAKATRETALQPSSGCIGRVYIASCRQCGRQH